VDPIENLVVPRFLALVLVTGLLDTFSLVAGMSSGLLTELLHGESLGGFFTTSSPTPRSSTWPARC
jgi:phospholipid/cholesterol/gamma-HCH transport system permease protein